MQTGSSLLTTTKTPFRVIMMPSTRAQKPSSMTVPFFRAIFLPVVLSLNSGKTPPKQLPLLSMGLLSMRARILS